MERALNGPAYLESEPRDGLLILPSISQSKPNYFPPQNPGTLELCGYSQTDEDRLADAKTSWKCQFSQHIASNQTIILTPCSCIAQCIVDKLRRIKPGQQPDEV